MVVRIAPPRRGRNRTEGSGLPVEPPGQKVTGASGRIRTCNPRISNPVLCPIELRTHLSPRSTQRGETFLVVVFSHSCCPVVHDIFRDIQRGTQIANKEATSRDALKTPRLHEIIDGVVNRFYSL
jgi:hypothetical protein